MDNNRQKELEQLNAFIDGELDIEDRAAVTARAARDPGYARELAALSRLKAATADCVPTPEIPLPRPSNRRGLFGGIGVAASLLLVIAAGIGWTVLEGRQTSLEAFVLDRAVALHRSWVPVKHRQTTKAAAHWVSAALQPHVPDLSANGLNLAYVGARSGAATKERLVVGYLGSRGCRLTLLVHNSKEKRPEKPRMIETESVLASIWRAGTLHYALIAEGMAKARFELIAATVHRASLERLPFDSDTRTALADNRAGSPPCRA